MVSEHMLTVGRDPRDWQAHRKIFFLYNFLFKRVFSLSSLLSLFKYPLLVIPYPLFPFNHTEIRLMRSLQEVQDIGQVRSFRNDEDFTMHYNNGNYNGWRLWRLGEFEGPVEFSRFVWPRKAPLMELGWLRKPSIPEIKVYRRKTEHGELKTSKFCQEKP